MSLKQIAIAIDQLANTLLGGMADEFIHMSNPERK